MMTTAEILNEIYKLPVHEQADIKRNLLERSEQSEIISEKVIWQKLFEEGFITHVPSNVSSEEDEFEPIEIEGEPISETIIRERR